MNKIRWYGPALLMVATVAIVMLMGPRVARQIAWAQTNEKITLVKDELKTNRALAELSSAFRHVAEVVEPSVVSIEVSAKVKPGRQSHGPQNDDMFRHFFGPQITPPQEEDQGNGDGEEKDTDKMDQFNVPRPYGSGSGWVYDNDGHIVTNNHVVEGSDTILVRFSDGTERKAKVVGVDTKTDVAVIKVEGGGVLHPASIATDPCEQGDIVFAFGSPLRFEFSMSQGIVSAKGRQLRIVADGQGYENFIQTDAAINPGNSGGPLTNIDGEVIGMNTAIASRTGTSNGIGFAIPSEMVNDVVKQIIKSGHVTRGYLGIVIENLDADKAASYDFKGKGVLVIEPVPDGPAAKAGIQTEDIITKVGDKTVNTVEELREKVARYAPGSKIPVTLFRGGKSMDVDVTVVEQPTQFASNVPGAAPIEKTAPGEDGRMQTLRKLGVENVATFTEEMAAQARVKHTPGVIIKGVRADSVAAAQGLDRFAIITHIAGSPVATVDELLDVLSKSDTSKGIRLRVIEGGHVRVVLLKMPG